MTAQHSTITPAGGIELQRTFPLTDDTAAGFGGKILPLLYAAMAAREDVCSTGSHRALALFLHSLVRAFTVDLRVASRAGARVDFDGLRRHNGR